MTTPHSIITTESLPEVSEFMATDSIVSMPRSELHLLRDLLESALQPRVKFDPINPNTAKMRQEAYGITNANIKTALDMLSKVK